MPIGGVDWDASEYEDPKEIWERDNDAYGKRIKSWPPTDPHGNEYPIEWIKDRELNHNGWLEDDRGQYNPFAGALQPVEGNCNAILTACYSRYPERRYCLITASNTHHYCPTHKGRRQMKTAREALQHGVSSQTRDHMYANLPDWKRVMVHGIHEDLLGESRYDFAPEYHVREFDFSDAPFDPDVDGDGPVYELKVPYATEKIQASLELFAAATDEIKQLSVNAIVAKDNLQEKTHSHAEHTGEGSGEEAFDTIEEWTEHHLNLPYSRLVRDKKELLKRGGVQIDGETDASGESPLLKRLADLTDEDRQPTELEAIEGSEMQRQMDAADVDLDFETVDE